MCEMVRQKRSLEFGERHSRETRETLNFFLEKLEKLERIKMTSSNPKIKLKMKVKVPGLEKRQN